MSDKASESMLAAFADCVGCSACESVCPQNCIMMTGDSFGFYHPLIDRSKCIGCKQCESVCPVIHKFHSIDQDSLQVYAGYSMRDDIRNSSSSGGIFTELSEYVLTNKGVVFGAAYDEDFFVHHVCVDHVNDLWKLRGAKYSQSKIGPTFCEVKSYLDSGRMVLFSGTPCQVAGLRSFLGRSYPTLVCVDFVCHGVSSPEVWHQYVQYRSRMDNNGVLPKFINLRDKESGWSHYKYSVHFRYSDDSEYKGINGQDIFTRLYSSNDIINTVCSFCKFKGTNRVSDITIGDFWGIWDICPEIDNRIGVSLIICNSRYGRDILQRISSRLYLKEMTMEQAVLHNLSYCKSVKQSRYRDEIIETASEGQIDKAIELLDHAVSISKSNLSKANKIISKLKKILIIKRDT